MEGRHTIHAEEARKLAALTYMLLKLKLSIKEAAAQMGVSERTVSRMVRRYGLGEKIALARAERLRDPVRYDESLTAFVVWVRIHDRETYRLIEDTYNQYLNTL